MMSPFSLWRRAPVVFGRRRLPLCGIADGENITRCGIGVKGFLPQSGKKSLNKILTATYNEISDGFLGRK
jgi:hypothetical protein